MSTRDPIEDMFRDNQQGLDEKPRDLIWDRIEERLDEKPVVKKKSNVWKYAVAASVFAVISLAGLYFLNPNENPSKMESIVLMESVEMNEEKATEILDHIEAESTAIVTTKSHTPSPEIMEEELKKPILSQPKNRMVPSEEISSFDEAIIAAPASAAQMEMEGEKVMMKEKQDEVLVFRGESPSKKEGNYILRNSELDDRRLGNMAEKSVSYEVAPPLKSLDILIKKDLISYQILNQTEAEISFINNSIAYPSQIILKKENDSIQVKYSGNEAKKDNRESKQIQEYIQANKEQIATNFGL